MPDILSPHFTVREFLATAHRAHVEEQERTWSENPELLANAQRTCAVLEQIREMVGPLRITSGYRCGALNTAVGGRPTSRHVLGLAADVQPIEMDEREAMWRIASALKAGALPDVDEAILEMGWLHIQTTVSGGSPRHLVLQTHDGVHFEPFKKVI